MLHERGLAYQAESLVNYDPVDRTVLANEQVDANGCSWRSGAKVEKVMLKQWFLKIKEYQESLLNDLDGLAHEGRWPEKVLAMQRNWIGKSEGATIRFEVGSTTDGEQMNALDVFTTRADTLFGVQYIALSLGHPIVQQQALGDASLRAFVEKAKDMPSDSKEGYSLPNITAKNPIADQTPGVESELPVYVAPYVLDDYGSGAVMGVPGHDTRDHAFWRANVGSDPIRVVVAAQPGTSPSPLVPGSDQDKPMTERGYVTADIERFKGLSSDEAMRKVVATLRKSGKHAEVTENWRLRDWLISRQRYWGTPIPIIHCSSCGAVPVLERDLPVKLPNLPDSFFDGRKGNPLAEDENWKKTECPKCGSAAERETDTMDTFMDSSWYFFRFLDPDNEAALLDSSKANKGMPVDLYVGGVEHAILHLLYARFISKFLASTSVWPDGRLVKGEPFKQLITQGMVHGETFTNPENGRFLRPDELDLTTRSAPRIKASGLTPTVSYEKMSKSKYNGVDPGATIASYGADATRAHMLFQAPVGDILEWDPKKITGVQRWLLRVIRLSTASWIPDDVLTRFEIPESSDMKLVDILRHLSQRELLTTSKELSAKPTEGQLLALLTPQELELWIKTQRTIASVNESYSQTYSLNTIVSDLMTLTNTIYDAPRVTIISLYLKWYAMVQLVRMLAPIAPGVAEEAWHLLNGSPDVEITDNSQSPRPLTVFATGFPVADFEIIPRITRTTKCVVQIDGKRKFEVEIEKNSDTHLLTNRDNMSRWVLDQLLQTDEGKNWLHRETGKIWSLSDTKEPHEILKFVPSDWKVIVVNHGRLCNLVSPKKKKAKNSDPESVAKAADVPAAVSHDKSSELNATALKQDSNKTSMATTDSKVMMDLDKGSKHPSMGEVDLQHAGAQHSKRKQDTKLDHENDLEQPTSARDNSAVTMPRLLPSLSTGKLPLQAIHTQVDALMTSLPSYLQPRYVPPHVYPVSSQAVLHVLRKTGLLPPKECRERESARYEAEFASLATPPTIAPKYIIDAPLSDLATWKREYLVMSYNAIFPEQITLLSHAPPTSDLTTTLLSVHRHYILRKLRKYRIWVNGQAVRPPAHGDGPASLPTMDELEIELGLSKQEIESGRADEGGLRYWPKTKVRSKAVRVQGVWEKIISLWAGLDGEKGVVPKKAETRETNRIPEDWHWIMGKSAEPEMEAQVEMVEQNDESAHWTFLAGKAPKSAEQQEEEDAELHGDWTWLVGEDSNRKWKPYARRRGPPKWG